ncbi:MAG TPA: PHP domain-containing protein [Nitrososphaerales archaeon]|nr:PHP domain-containing protein [Nitrososphaerales archaeon]
MHYDNHSHIILASIESMVDAAKKTQVSRLSTTEHISQFTFARQLVRFGSVHESGRMFSSFDDYLREFEKLKSLDEVQVRKGLEVDYIGKYSSDIGKVVSRKKWDVLLCSVHELPGGIDLEDKSLPQDRKSADDRWREYVETQKEAIKSDFIPFAILTHPERLAVGTPQAPKDFEDLMIELSKVAKEHGKAVELNGADLSRSPELVRKVASACGKTHCKVSYGSDSHYPDQVSRNYDLASKLIEEFHLEVI